VYVFLCSSYVTQLFIFFNECVDVFHLLNQFEIELLGTFVFYLLFAYFTMQ